VGGNADGQTFTDTGFLLLNGYTDELAASHPTTEVTANLGYKLYFDFTGLAGTAHTVGCPGGASGCINFDPGVGLVRLILDKTDTVDTTDILTLATFSVANPSTGTFGQFFGGSGPNGNIDLTLTEASSISSHLFQDSLGNDLLMGLTLHLINLDALCSGNCAPQPGLTGPFDVTVQTAGQYNLATNALGGGARCRLRITGQPETAAHRLASSARDAVGP
jgi:hypothetical protein